MRKSILLPLLVLACSGDAAESSYRLIPDFLATAETLACSPVELGEVAVDRLHSATDTSFVVLDAAQQRITEFDDRLHPLWSLEYDDQGPAGVDRPVDAVLLGDSAVAVAARGGLRLVVMDRAGRLIHAEPLPFIPNALTPGEADDLWLTAMPLGGTPDSLLFRFRRQELEKLPVPRRPYDDMTVGALGNATLAASLPGGSVLVIHQFFAPRGFRVEPGTGTVTPVPVPTPDATLGQIDFIPRAPVTADQFASMLTPALALTVDRARGEIYVLTKSGREVRGRPQRAILRLDDSLAPRSTWVLDVHGVHLAYLARRDALIVADDADGFHLCPLDAPARGE